MAEIEQKLNQTDDIQEIQRIFEKEFSSDGIKRWLPAGAQKYPEIVRETSSTLLNRAAEMLVDFSHRKGEFDSKKLLPFAGKYAVFILHILRIELGVVGFVLDIVLKIIATAVGQGLGLSTKAAGPAVLAAPLLLLSGREYKTDIEDLSDAERADIVREFNSLPVQRWQYYWDQQRHLGPIAQEWHARFPSAGPEYTLPVIDMLGVLMVVAQHQAADTRALRKEVLALRGKINNLN